MKKVILFVAGAALITGSMVSCGKSTKGKMDGEWTIDSYVSNSTNTSGGMTSSDKVNATGGAITITSTSGGTTTTETGTFSNATYTISKDGTWSSKMTVVFVQTLVGTTFTTTNSDISSGTWDFLSGVGEFKKHERVVFNTLSSSSTQVNTSGGTSTTSTNSDTYAEGENSLVYLITESKGKSLILTSTAGNTSTSGTSTSSSANSTTLTLSQK
jgi:hypothetical protein